ncbi:MAG: NrfD/PsrC family molybdoenzyme membrane anchor subunit [Terriglobales bacterium]
MAERVPITEEQLDTLRTEAAQKGRVQAIGIVPSSSPFPQPASASYHGNAVLKPPTWTWQVPLYFFVGGGSGISAVIALVAHIVGNVGVTRAASWVGLVGGLISAPLLVADLGRPARFLNMLRVFKPQSAMSMGAWTLVVFSSAVSLGVVCQELNVAGYGSYFLLGIEWLAQILAAVSGLILASYTSVLLGVTAIPVWSENRKLVSAVFLAGALGSATAVLELLGFLIPATQFMGIAASTAELIIATVIELRDRYVDRPLREGRAGWLVRGGAVLAGPISLLLRIFSGHNPHLREIAAVCFAVGALVTRYGWIAAGRVSALDPQALFQIQRRGEHTGETVN